MIEFPIELIRYILSFYKEWQIVGDRFVNIANLTRILRPTLHCFAECLVAMELKFLDKCYVLIYDRLKDMFFVVLKYNNYSNVKCTYFSENRDDWRLNRRYFY